MESYSEVLNWIYNLRGGEIDLRLDRMDQALGLFDHPERQFPTLHIAGTNGKGSTAAILHSILSRGGYKTALYTSPHLESFTERIRVGANEILPQEVVALAREVKQLCAHANIQLTFFEFVTVIALVFFARQKVDTAVVEVGLGGRLDATNLVSPLVSIITTIANDHEAYLGHDLLSIAREKAGIIKPQTPVVVGAVPREVRDLFKGSARKLASSSYHFEDQFRISLKNEGVFDYTGIKHHLTGLKLRLLGLHQKRNAAVALAALELIAEKFPINEAAIRDGLEAVVWPGRLEIMSVSPTIILDGAHNGEGVDALVTEMETLRGRRKVSLLFASMADKDWRSMTNRLAEVVDEIVFTRVAMERSADPQKLAGCLMKVVPHRVIDDAQNALGLLINGAKNEDIIVVAGSLYLIGEIRPAVQTLLDQRTADSTSPESNLGT